MRLTRIYAEHVCVPCAVWDWASTQELVGAGGIGSSRQFSLLYNSYQAGVSEFVKGVSDSVSELFVIIFSLQRSVVSVLSLL